LVTCISPLTTALPVAPRERGSAGSTEIVMSSRYPSTPASVRTWTVSVCEPVGVGGGEAFADDLFDLLACRLLDHGLGDLADDLVEVVQCPQLFALVGLLLLVPATVDRGRQDVRHRLDEVDVLIGELP
jgi:hypothetical protein